MKNIIGNIFVQIAKTFIFPAEAVISYYQIGNQLCRGIPFLEHYSYATFKVENCKIIIPQAA